jgi:hypothetical protein
MIGVGYVAAVECGNKTVRCTCRHEKEQFSKELILWQVLDNLWNLKLPQQCFCRMNKPPGIGKQLPTSKEL